MKTIHKRKGQRIGEIVEGIDARRGLWPQVSLEEIEEITIRVLDERIRLGELAYKGYTSPEDLHSPYYIYNNEPGH